MDTFDGGSEFNPDDLYDQYPSGEELGYGRDQGYNGYFKLNDRALFREELLDPGSPDYRPDLAAFVRLGEEPTDDDPFPPISVNVAQFKSSTREWEWALHKPHLAMAGEVPGIDSGIDNFPAPDEARIGTFFINHDRTLAIRKLSVVAIEDGAQCGQMIYKHFLPERE